MKFAVNYSLPTLELLQAQQVQFDLFKLPAWPDLVEQVSANYPTYVHTSLRAGTGSGLVSSGDAAPDWDAIDRMLSQTNTPIVNVHLTVRQRDYPDIDPADISADTIERLTEALIADVAELVERYGANRVVAENMHGRRGEDLQASILAETITTVIEESGCQLLFDLSHARMAAHLLGMTPGEYIEALPLKRMKELHITGLHRIDPVWADNLQQHGFSADAIAKFSGHLLDHLPLGGQDWMVVQRLLARIHQGDLPKPEIVALEYGGMGENWHTAPEIIQAQVPRLNNLVHLA
ncbi:MAG: DUF692 family protein [Chloroflexi bacterium]|nr:DUF692 family protein [Chloroflexota bacterium]